MPLMAIAPRRNNEGRQRADRHRISLLSTSNHQNEASKGEQQETGHKANIMGHHTAASSCYLDGIYYTFAAGDCTTHQS